MIVEHEPSEALRLFKALADESRLKIVGLLAGSERNVQELAAALGLKEPTVSHHLAVLRAAGLAGMRTEGTIHWYRLDLDALRAASRSMLSREKLATFAGPADAAGAERKVLSAFIENDRIKDIPVPRKKRWMVLKWLAARLPQGESFPENQLNEILKRYHWDTATIRREMVGYRMLTRNKGVYTVMPQQEWKSEEKYDPRGLDDPRRH